MLFFNHFSHILRHAGEVSFWIPAPLFAGSAVVHFNFTINLEVEYFGNLGIFVKRIL